MNAAIVDTDVVSMLFKGLPVPYTVLPVVNPARN